MRFRALEIAPLGKKREQWKHATASHDMVDFHFHCGDREMNQTKIIETVGESASLDILTTSTGPLTP